MIPMPLRDAHGMQLPPQFDPSGKPFYLLDDGSKRYLSPMEAKGIQTTSESPNAQINSFLSSTHESGTPQSLTKTRESWDPTTGQWKSGVNYSNLLSAGVGTALTAGAASAFMGGAAAPMAAGTGELSSATTAVPTLAATVPGATAGGAAAATTGAAATGGLAASAVPGAGLIGAVPGAGAVSGIAGASPMSFLSSMIPNGGDILKGIGGYLQGRSQSKSEAQQRADALLMNQQKREDDMRTQIANFLASQQTQRLNATQMDPYAQAKSLNSLNVRRSFNPNAGANSNFDLSAMDPSNLSAENTKFQAAANDTGTQKQILDYLGQNGGPNTKVCYDPKNGTQIPCPTAGVR